MVNKCLYITYTLISLTYTLIYLLKPLYFSPRFTHLIFSLLYTYSLIYTLLYTTRRVYLLPRFFTHAFFHTHIPLFSIIYSYILHIHCPTFLHSLIYTTLILLYTGIPLAPHFSHMHTLLHTLLVIYYLPVFLYLLLFSFHYIVFSITPLIYPLSYTFISYILSPPPFLHAAFKE